MELIVRPAAIANIREARDYYEAAQAGLGERFGEAVDRVFRRLLVFPRSAPGVEGYGSIRRATVSGFPYGVFYVVEGNRLDVLRVVHAKQLRPS